LKTQGLKHKNLLKEPIINQEEVKASEVDELYGSQMQQLIGMGFTDK